MSINFSKVSFSPDYYYNGQVFTRENYPRQQQASSGIALTSGVMLSTAIYLEAGDVITSLTFRSGSQAAVAPTAWWFALYSTATTPALLAQTADQTTTAWAANTNMTVNLASAQTIATTGIHYASIMMAAGTTVNLSGFSMPTGGSANAIVTGQKILSQTSGSSLTTTAPSTISGVTAVGTRPYVVAR